jgi:hypothetical protein
MQETPESGEVLIVLGEQDAEEPRRGNQAEEAVVGVDDR